MIKDTEVPLYGESDDISYVRNMLKVDILPGWMTGPEVLKSDYTIVELSSTVIKIKFTFEDPLEVSQNDPTERVKVTLTMEKYVDQDGLSLEPGTELTKFVPRQIPSEAEAETLEKAREIMGAAIGGTMASSFAITVIMGASLNQLWSMVNGLQLAVHLPLFSSNFPANASFILTLLIDIATFDMLPEEVTDFFFDFPDKDPYNEAFEATRYESMYAVENLGICFMLINVYLLQCVIWIISYFFIS